MCYVEETEDGNRVRYPLLFHFIEQNISLELELAMLCDLSYPFSSKLAIISLLNDPRGLLRTFQQYADFLQVLFSK